MESEREDKVRKSGKKPACCKQVEGPSQRSPLAWRYTIGEINTYNCFFSFFPGWTLGIPDSAVLCVPCAEVT